MSKPETEQQPDQPMSLWAFIAGSTLLILVGVAFSHWAFGTPAHYAVIGVVGGMILTELFRRPKGKK